MTLVPDTIVKNPAFARLVAIRTGVSVRHVVSTWPPPQLYELLLRSGRLPVMLSRSLISLDLGPLLL